MSIKLEKTDVSSARLSSGCSVSNDAMTGVRKCCDRRDRVSSVIEISLSAQIEV